MISIQANVVVQCQTQAEYDWALNEIQANSPGVLTLVSQDPANLRIEAHFSETEEVQ